MQLRVCAVLQQILLKLFSLSTASTNGFLDSFYSECIEDNIIKVYFIGFLGRKIIFKIEMLMISSLRFHEFLMVRPRNSVSLEAISLLQNLFFTIKVYTIVIIIYYILYNRIKLNDLTLIKLKIWWFSKAKLFLLHRSFSSGGTRTPPKSVVKQTTERGALWLVKNKINNFKAKYLQRQRFKNSENVTEGRDPYDI